MGLMDWLRGDLGRKNSGGNGSPDAARNRVVSRVDIEVAKPLSVPAHESASKPLQPPGKDPDLSVEGLDFMEAISAHQRWKGRLLKLINGESTEKLVYQTVCRDDQCALGKWINGEAGAKLGHLPAFAPMKVAHAQFHLTAGRIVQLVDENKIDEAKGLLRNGEYSQLSVRVQGLISSLYMEAREQA